MQKKIFEQTRIFFIRATPLKKWELKKNIYIFLHLLILELRPSDASKEPRSHTQKHHPKDIHFRDKFRF